MRKIFIILCCFGILSAHATEMCARDDTVVIPLDATINPTVNIQTTFNATEWLWWMVFDYGTIYGASACLSKKEIIMYSDWNGTGSLPVNLTLNTASDELIGTSGYYMNADTNPDIPDAEKADYKRVYCFGKMTHPMSTPWVIGTHLTMSDCANACNNRFGFQTSVNRSTLFNSIGTTPPWPLD